MINVILTVLADEELRDIFNIIKEKPVSAHEILRYTKIPHTSFYRKINLMLNNRLVIIDSIQETILSTLLQLDPIELENH